MRWERGLPSRDGCWPASGIRFLPVPIHKIGLCLSLFVPCPYSCLSLFERVPRVPRVSLGVVPAKRLKQCILLFINMS